MTNWHCECRDDDCQVCTISSLGNPYGTKCSYSRAHIYKTQLDRTPGDLAFSMSNRTDVRWAKGVREYLVKSQTKGGKLICGICNLPIATDGNGKISYVSSSGTTHVEYPPIDHYNPDWRDRKRTVENSTAYKNGDVAKQKQLLMSAYNAWPLRISHRSCNLSRKKA